MQSHLSKKKTNLEKCSEIVEHLNNAMLLSYFNWNSAKRNENAINPDETIKYWILVKYMQDS